MREFLRRQVRNAHSVLSADRALIARVFRNFIWLTMGNAASMSFGFLATVYIARTLGKSDFGKVTFAMTISVYASVVVDLGLNTYGNRAVARNPDRLRECLGNILGFQLVVAFALIALTALSAIFFRGSADPELRLLIFLSMLWLVPFACNMDWVFLGIEKMSVVGGARLVQQMAYFTLLVCLVRGPEQLLSVPILKTTGGLLSALLLFFLLPRNVFLTLRINLLRVKEYFKSAVFFWMSAVLVQILAGSAVLFLGILRSPTDVGIYSVGFQIMALLMAIISLINTALFPLSASLYQNNQRQFYRLRALYLYCCLILAAAVLACGLIFSPFIVSLVFGESYQDSVKPLYILIFAAACNIVNGAIAQPLLAAGFERDIFRQSFGTAIFNILANLLLIPFYGPMGAATAYLLAVVGGTIWAYMISSRKLSEPPTGLLEGTI